MRVQYELKIHTYIYILFRMPILWTLCVLNFKEEIIFSFLKFKKKKNVSIFFKKRKKVLNLPLPLAS